MTTHDPLDIGIIIRNGVIFDPKNWQGGVVAADRLLEDVARLFTLLDERRLDYVLVGGIAMLRYVQGRNTQDIDLIMSLPALRALPEVAITSQDANFARGRFDQLQIDFLLTRNRLFEAVRRYATYQEFGGRTVKCATVEGLLLLKLYALPSLYRQDDLDRVGIYENDIAGLLRHYRPAMPALWQELAPHVSASDLAALQDIVADIQRRSARFGREFGAGGDEENAC